MSGRMIVIMWTLLNEIKKVGIARKEKQESYRRQFGKLWKSPFSP